MFRKILAAGVMAAGMGFAGTATEVEAGDRYRFDRGDRHHHRHFRGDRGRFHIQPYPYYGGSRFGYRDNFYRSPGRFYGGPGFRQPHYGNRGGLFIGGRNFSLGIFR